MSKQKYYVFSFFAILCSLGSFAQDIDTPKLVVGIVVDQMRYDYLSRFEDKYGDGGFKLLQEEGFSFQNNNLNYIPTNTAPGHASIYTGTTPSVHGILGNSWYDKATKQPMSCVYDANVEPVGVGNSSGKKSPKHLLVNTIGDYYKDTTQQPGKTISISLKDRAAVLSGGFKADAAYWLSGGDLGFWISSTYYLDNLPDWVRTFNSKGLIDTYLQEWNTLYDIDTYFESDIDLSSHERGFRSKTTANFPYDLKMLKVENGGYDILKSTPFGNSYTFEFAKEALKGEDLGNDDKTDFLLISLSSTDYIGHNFGVDSKEVEDTYLRLDIDLQNFIKTLDAEVGKDNYVLFLTADHGASQNGHYLQEHGEKASFFKEGTFRNEVKAEMFNQYKDANIIENLSDNQIVLNKSLIEEFQLDTETIENELKEFILKNPEIARVATRTELLNDNITDKLGKMIKNGFHPERSGDIFYLLKPNVVVYSEQGSSHGSAYEFDTHVPLIFFGKGVDLGTSNLPTNSTMIVPTLASFLGITLPDIVDAKSLFED